MATSTAQRTGIWIITIVLIIGTLAGFIAMILAPKNEQADSSRLSKAQSKYQKEAKAAQDKQAAQEEALKAETPKLSDTYYKEFSSKASLVGKFDRDMAQKKLVIKDIKAGSGETIGDDTTYATYYIGYMSDGKTFESSIDGKKLSTPIIGRPGGLIAGWMEGAKGMKMGGIRQLTIPSEKAYGEAGQGSIPSNAPLMFIIMPIKTLETINQPEIPQELLQAYGQ